MWWKAKNHIVWAPKRSISADWVVAGHSTAYRVNRKTSSPAHSLNATNCACSGSISLRPNTRAAVSAAPNPPVLPGTIPSNWGGTRCAASKSSRVMVLDVEKLVFRRDLRHRYKLHPVFVSARRVVEQVAEVARPLSALQRLAQRVDITLPALSSVRYRMNPAWLSISLPPVIRSYPAE